MADKQTITEKDNVHPAWYEEAKALKTPMDLLVFMEKLSGNYHHDYGTVCHFVAASAIGAANVANCMPGACGGITGFQAGAVMWEFIQNWMLEYKNKPLRIVDYSDMLYPQYESKFRTISKDTWAHLQAEAGKEMQKLADGGGTGHPTIVAHWQSILRGDVPFGYTVE